MCICTVTRQDGDFFDTKCVGPNGTKYLSIKADNVQDALVKARQACLADIEGNAVLSDSIVGESVYISLKEADNKNEDQNDYLAFNYASFENVASVAINLFCIFDAPVGGTQGIARTTIEPGKVAEVVFDTRVATVCHRSDGGDFVLCPDGSKRARAGDYFRLKENGEYQD